MKRKLVPWILVVALIGFFSWPGDLSAHGGDDHGKQTGGCANVP